MKNKYNLNGVEKRVLLVEAVLVFGIFIYLFFAMIPTQVYPLSGMAITDPEFVFEIQNGEQVIVSTDEAFTNPIILQEGSDVILPPGIYYWKVKSMLRESKVNIFTIQSHTALDLKPRGEKYELENSGNVDLEVEAKKQGVTSGSVFDIQAGESVAVEKDDTEYTGGQA